MREHFFCIGIELVCCYNESYGKLSTHIEDIAQIFENSSGTFSKIVIIFFRVKYKILPVFTKADITVS